MDFPISKKVKQRKIETFTKAESSRMRTYVWNCMVVYFTRHFIGYDKMYKAFTALYTKRERFDLLCMVYGLNIIKPDIRKPTEKEIHDQIRKTELYTCACIAMHVLVGLALVIASLPLIVLIVLLLSL